jgi:hemolysin activation/secretion protein
LKGVLVGVNVCLGFVGTGTVYAQDYERIAPKMVEKSVDENGGGIEMPPIIDEESVDKNEKVLVPELKGLILSSTVLSKEELESRDLFGVQTVDLEVLDHPKVQKKFQKKLKIFLDQPVTMNQLKRISREIILFYRKQDRPVIDVSVPQQDITSGIVQMVILEGRLGKLKVEGAQWFSSQSIENQIQLKSGEIVSSRKLANDINWINSNPFREVTALLSRGEERGETDVTLRVRDRFPLRVYTGYEDSGTDLTEDQRIFLGFNYGDLFSLGHQLNYQFMTDPDIEKIRAHSGSYIIPLPWRHRMAVLGSYVESRVADEGVFSLAGESVQISTRYTVPLPVFVEKYLQEFSGGFDFKRSDNELEFGVARVFKTQVDIAQFFLEYSSVLQDSWGETSLAGVVKYSPGGLTDQNENEVFNRARSRASARYVYGSFTLNRSTDLPWDLTLTNKFTMQFSDANLLGSERMGFGGYSSVRGYEEREINGDQGYFFSTELKLPVVSFTKFLGTQWNNLVEDSFRAHLFFDYGVAENHFLLIGEDAQIQLASVGAGFRYRVSSYASLRFDYGWQLEDTGLNSPDNSRGHMGVVLAY